MEREKGRKWRKRRVTRRSQGPVPSLSKQLWHEDGEARQLRKSREEARTNSKKRSRTDAPLGEYQAMDLSHTTLGPGCQYRLL